ncbi:hypothetical protein LIER_35761 [Lithospermum erythrorhizon]|uniref:Uncharacterized protein n=1 Tax=Lithospermum erythrorhizon TaxID=34254 RepID=A0AAV3P0M1_LITER
MCAQHTQLMSQTSSLILKTTAGWCELCDLYLMLQLGRQLLERCPSSNKENKQPKGDRVNVDKKLSKTTSLHSTKRDTKGEGDHTPQRYPRQLQRYLRASLPPSQMKTCQK